MVKVGVSRRFTKGSYGVVVQVDLDKALSGFKMVANIIRRTICRK